MSQPKGTDAEPATAGPWPAEDDRAELARLHDAAIMYHLWSNKHQMWWRAESVGYSPDVEDAGLYSERDAVERVLRSADCGILSQVTCMVAAPVNWSRS